MLAFIKPCIDAAVTNVRGVDIGVVPCRP